MKKICYHILLISLLFTQKTQTHDINLGILNQSGIKIINYEYSFSPKFYSSIGIAKGIINLDGFKDGEENELGIPIAFHYRLNPMFDVGLGVMYTEHETITSLLIGLGKKNLIQFQQELV